MLKTHTPKGLKATELIAAVTCAVAAFSHAARADNVYRCAEAYSTSPQCGSGTATEVRPTSVLSTSGPATSNTSTRDLHDAQALEKQRLQAERQATQTAPIRLAPIPTTASTPYASVPQENLPTKRKGKHVRKSNSPFFTAVDPTTRPQKKSTAKAVQNQD